MPEVLAPYLLAVLFVIAYSALSLARFHRYATPSWDNAIFEQAIRGYAHLGAPVVNIKGVGYNVLGDHFSPVTALVAPVYRLFPHAQTLLITQAVLVASSIVPITRAATARLGLIRGLAIGTAYALSFGIQSAIYVDFHEVAFAAPLLALAGVAYLDKRWRAVAAWSAPLLLVKEDMGLTVLAIATVLLLQHARRIGLVLAVTATATFFVVLLVVLPSINPAGHYDYTKTLVETGANGTPAFLAGWDVKAVTLLLTFAVTGFVALRSPWTLVVIPTFGWRFVGSSEFYWGTTWHYSLALMPIVFVAMLDAMVRMRRRARPWRQTWQQTYLRILPAVVLAVAVVLCPRFPLKEVVRPATYADSPRADAAQRVMALIPTDASVETDIGLITHLTSDRDVYWAGTMGSAVPDYVLIDVQAGWGALPDVVAYAEQHHPGTLYEQIFASDGYLLAKRAD